EHGYFRAVFTQESRTIEAELFGRSETISGQPAFRASAENMVEKDGRQIIGSFKVEYSDRGFVDVTQKLGDIYALKFLNKQGRRWLPPESLQLTDEQGKMKGLEPYRIVDRKGQELRLAVLDPRGVEVMRFYPDEDNPQKLVAAFFYPEADGRKRVVVAERKEAPANKKVFIIKAEDIDHRSQEFKEAKISVEFSGQPAERVDIDLKDLVVVGDEQFARDPDESRLYLVRKGLMHHEEYAQLFQIGKKPDHQGYLSYVAVLKDQTLIPNTDILGQIAVKARVKVEGDEVKELILDSKVDHYTRGVGKFEFVINGKIVKFTLVQAYRKDGKLDREFGVIKGKELISIGFDRHLFIVDKRLLDKKSGGTFIVDTDSDGRFRSIWQIHRSEEIDYKDLKEVDSQGRLIWDYHKVEAVMKQLKKSGRFSALPDLEKLVWVRMQTLDREGKVLKETIEAYDQAIPSIVISKGFLHLVVEKDAGRDKTGKERNKGLSIAFDLARKLESGLFISTAISRFVTPEKSIVVDSQNRFAILEDKHHKDRHLMNKYRLGVAGPVTNSNGKPFDLFKPVSFETDSAGRLKEPKHLDDFLDFVQYKVEIHNGTIEAEGLTVEAKEELYFDYQEILKVIAELEKNVGQKVFSRQELTNLKKVLDKYSATALRVYGISAFTVTKVNGPDKEARKGGVSVVQEIKYLGQKPVIIFKSKGLVKDETDKLFLGTDEKLVYSDIEGNYFIIKEQRSVTYVYGFDRYGRGLLSLRVVPYQEGKKLTEVDPTAKKLINNVSLYKGLHTLTQNLAFIKFEGEILAEDVSGREVVLGENVEDNYRQLQGKQLRARLIVEGGRKYSSLQNLLIELKDGQGLTRIRLANTDLDLTQLMYGQISLQNWAQTQGLDQQVDHMNEIIFLDYLPEDTKKIYVSLVASRIAHESWSHQVRRDSKGQIIFEEAAYLSERNPSNSLWGWLLRKKKFRYLDHTYNPRFIKGSILLEYQVDTNRPGRSDGTVVTTLSGTIV
ncbi:MAG: hypothetical protein KJ977_01360, partial [Candidatus Omnitrophica bacterium]|nr:hypothetical protein [Candidatus Omnitrophota bacterium]